jgi:hypothetical protein
MMPLGLESGATSVAATTTEADGLHNTFATGITTIPSQSSSSSSGFNPRSNWTAGYNTTNGSFVNLPSSPRTAFTVFTGGGESHRHINVPGMLPFLVFQVAVVSLL